MHFNWKQRAGKKGVGSIAEEVAKVLPEVVSLEEDGKTPRGVSYSSIVAVAIEGVKEQQKQIERMEADSAVLKEQLASLQGQLASLTAQLADTAKMKQRFSEPSSSSPARLGDARFQRTSSVRGGPYALATRPEHKPRQARDR